MNQSEFAARLGVGHSTVSRWVNGRVPEAGLLERIADVLVLDYDLVATKAGYRPAIHEVPPDSREARAAHLVTRIDWEAPGTELVVSMLEQLAINAPKRNIVANEE
jgi:transcriptional regulator with XRE-family HTH domain